MIEQFQHRATTSFLLWFDNFLLRKGEAFSNQTGKFFNYADDRLDSRYKPYGSAYKQWVTDSSVNGVTNPVIPTSFNGSGRSDDIIFDFENEQPIHKEETVFEPVGYFVMFFQYLA